MSRRVLIAPNSFKESLSATEVARAMAGGVKSAWPDATVVCIPMADGGEGFVNALCGEGRGEIRESTVQGPLGETVTARWGLLGDGKTAVIEMAQAAGLGLVPAERRDPRITSTRGVGDLLLLARDAGVREVLIGIGGSATNDGGMGMAQTLGVEFFDEHDERIDAPGCGSLLAQVARVKVPDFLALGEMRVRVACDVVNPLLGAEGSAHVYAPQKGASDSVVEELERGMTNFAEVVERDLNIAVRDLPGAGASGGLGAGLVAFAGASLENGAALVLAALGFEEALRGVDLVITGEGAVNEQTLQGKGPWEVVSRATDRGVRVLFIAGDATRAPSQIVEHPLISLRSLVSPEVSREWAMAEASALIEERVKDALGTIR